MGNDELVELPGFRLHGSGTSATEHRLDIAVAHLTATTADHLEAKGCVFLTPDQIGEQFDFAWPMYAALGYPHSTTRRVGQNAFRAQPVLFTSGGLENEDYREMRLEARVYIAMQYDHKKVRTDGGVHSSKTLTA